MSDLLSELPESRRWQNQWHPIPVVAAMICREVENVPMYLLIKRVHQPYAGKWALIGGRWDFGETLPQAVTREAREETGLITDFVALRGFVNERVFPQQPDGIGAQFSIFVCEVHSSQGEPREQDEGQVAWFNEKELNDLWSNRDIAPTDYFIVKHYLAAAQRFLCLEAEVFADITGNSASEIRRFDKILC